MQILFFSLLIGFGVFMLASVLVWAFRMPRYIESHRERSANVIFRLGSPILRDYLTARRIADRAGHKPGFLVLFERLFVTSIAFFIAGLVALVIGSLR
jgi:hypothetical protein